jgi:RNA polymerase sigma-70 factor (ECF subfamily)
MQLSSVVARDDGEDALVALARGGDRDAFARLIGPRADRVLRTARAILGNEAEAHDAAQTAMVSAWVHLPRLREIDRFDAWINRILRNACNEILRTRRWSRVVDISTAEAESSAGLVTNDLATASVDAAAVRAAFGRLRVDDRTILLLHHLHDMPLEEVARQLGIPAGTAKSRLWGARRALERALEAER